MEVNLEIEKIAIEMKLAAEAMPMDFATMQKGIATQQFPEELSRTAIVNGKKYRVKFSHDMMPNQKGRTLAHLSFASEDGTIADDQTRLRFQRAFFGEDSKICPNSNLILAGIAKLAENEIILIPSAWGSRVVQMGKLT